MSNAATYLWYKPNQHSSWIKRFVILSNSVIRIYETRENFELQQNAIHLVQLTENTQLIDGSDCIIHQGWLIKKGKLKWNARWCALLKYGYLKYVDIKQNSDIRQIDFSKAKFTLQKYHNLMYWMYHGDRVYFRCDSPSIQKVWYQKMILIQTNCKKIRHEYKKKGLLHKEPTLFAFTLINKSEKHYFCTANDIYLAAWKKCIFEQISRSESGSNLQLKNDNDININIDAAVDKNQQNIRIISAAQVTYIRDSTGKINLHDLDENKSNSISSSSTNSDSNNVTPELVYSVEESISQQNNDVLDIENIIAATQKLILMDAANATEQNVKNGTLEHKIDAIDNSYSKEQSDKTKIEQKDIDEADDINGELAEKSQVIVNNNVAIDVGDDMEVNNDAIKVDEDKSELTINESNADIDNNVPEEQELKIDNKDENDIDIKAEDAKIVEGNVIINYDDYGTFVENQCNGNETETCESLKRIILILKIYKDHVNKHNKHFAEYLENIKSDLINDYHHILDKHLNEDKMSLKQSNDQFESIYKKIMQQNENDLVCDITKCSMYARNNREREKNVTKYNDEKLSVFIDLLDSIHCYFIHSVGVGFRMIVKPPLDCRNNGIAYDPELASLKAYLLSIRKNIETIGRTNRFSNKFITQTLFNDHKEERKEEKMDKYEIECKDGVYMFGQNFEHYWNKLKKPKYSTLKTELIDNKIFCIDLDAFKEVCKKADFLINNSNVIKNMKSCKESKYKIKKGLILNRENIICLILYTDYDILSYHFSKTFQPIKANEFDIAIKERNYEYFNWSKILCETVNCYGISMQDSKVSTLFSCVDFLYFHAFDARFNGPTSTTTKLQNAVIFSKDDGVILELRKEKKNSKLLRYFNCCFVSCFGNEDERLFINSPILLELVSIRNLSTNENYLQFMEALSAFNKLIDKQHLPNIADPLKVIINNLISFSMSKYDETTKYPKYILKSFKKWTDSKQQVVINLKLLKHFGINLLFESDKVKNLLDFHRVNIVFKETTWIISERVGAINTALLKSLLVIIDKINKLSYSKVDKVYLYDIPNIHKYAATKDYAKYQSLFVEKNWKIETKSGYSSDYLVVSK